MANASRSPDDLLTVADAARLVEELRGRPCSGALIGYYVRTQRLACVRTRGGIRLFLGRQVEELARMLADADAARVARAG